MRYSKMVKHDTAEGTRCNEHGSLASTISSANSVSDFTSHVARLRSRSSSGRARLQERRPGACTRGPPQLFSTAKAHLIGTKSRCLAQETDGQQRRHAAA